MKKFWFLMAFPLALAFTACSDDNDNDDPTNLDNTENPGGNKPDNPVDPKYDVITFENCQFPGKAQTNIVEGSEFWYEESGVRFEGAEYYSMYAGCLVSSMARIQGSDIGTPYPYCVALPKGTEHPGANGSDKFGIIIKSNFDDLDYDPAFAFETGVEREIVSLDVMNSMDMHQFMKWGYYSYDSLVSGEWVKATFIGYNAEGNKTDSADIYLGDFRDGKTFILEEWTSLDLSKLGKVNKVFVDIKWANSWKKPNTPTSYTICVDNIKFAKE